MAEKLSKRELQSPDKFQQEAGGFLDWAHEHPKQVAMAGGGLLVAILAVGLAFGGRGDGLDHRAGAELAAALELVDRPVGAAEAGLPPDAERPFSSQREKQEAIAEALAEVRRNHPGTTTAASAALPLADARFKLGQYDEALSLYDEYLRAAPKSSDLRFLALEGRAQSLEAKGDAAGAIQAWERFAQEAPTYRDRALFGKGRLLEQQGRRDEAKAAYEQIAADFPSGAVTRLAAERLAAIGRANAQPALSNEGAGQ